MAAETTSCLRPLESMSCVEIEKWLERALRGQESLPLAIPDEAPFLAIARHEPGLDELRRRDIQAGALALARRYVREGDDDDAYVASLLGLVNKLGVRAAGLPLSLLAVGESFDELPVPQQSEVLGTLVDLHVSLADEQWLKWARIGRHQALALSGLLSNGMSRLERLPEFDADAKVGAVLSLLLSEHCHELDRIDQERMLRLGGRVIGQCSGSVRAAVQEWLDEFGELVDAEPSADEDHPNVIQGEFFAAFNAQNGSMYLGVESTTARLAV